MTTRRNFELYIEVERLRLIDISDIVMADMNPAQLRELIASTQPIGRPHPTFKGKIGDDFLKWRKSFTRWFAASGRPNASKVIVMASLLEDDAADFFEELTDEQKANFAEATPLLDAKFPKDVNKEVKGLELCARFQKPKEGTVKFAQDLKKKVNDAYPDMQEEAKNEILLRHFLYNMLPELRKACLTGPRPADFDEALERAKTAEQTAKLDAASNFCKLQMSSPKILRMMNKKRPRHSVNRKNLT
jgi:hypothetical protein